MSNNKLYVGGLPYSVTDDKLQEIFSPHGTVESARVITDRMTGRSRGFGFVEMSSQSEAEEATKNLNGTDLEGTKPYRERGQATAGAIRRWRRWRTRRRGRPLVVSSSKL